MEWSTDRMNDTHEQDTNFDGSPGALKTPSPLMIEENDSVNRVECRSSNELLEPNEFPDYLNNGSMSLNTDLEEKTDGIIADLQEIKKITRRTRKCLPILRKSTGMIETILLRHEQSIARIETTLQKQGRKMDHIVSLLEQYSTSNPENTQRFARRQTSEVPLSVDEIPTTSQEPSIDRFVRNLVRDNQSRHLPSVTTTTLSKSNSRFFVYPTREIDKIQSDKNRGKIQTGQWSQEIYVGTTGDTRALLLPTEPKNPTSNEEENSIDYQPSSRLAVTTTVNLVSTHKVKLCLLHPLKAPLNVRTKRNISVLDWLGDPPVLLVCGGNLPEGTQLQIDAVSRSSEGCFRNAYRFSVGTNQYKDFDSRLIETSSSSPQRMKLSNLNILKISHEPVGEKGTFTVKPYPLGEPIQTKIKKLHKLNEKYKFVHIQLAFRCDQDTLYSNTLSTPENQPDKYHLKVKIGQPHQNTVSFDAHKLCPMKFLIEIPEPFHCTLLSGYKWIEASVISNGTLNPYYFLDTVTNEKKNPYYIKIDKISFDFSLTIGKQTLPELSHPVEQQIENLLTTDIIAHGVNPISSITGSGRFHIQFKLLHSEDAPNKSSIHEYTNCQSAKTKEFIEIEENQNEDEIGRSTGQKRTNESICDVNDGSTTCKRR